MNDTEQLDKVHLSLSGTGVENPARFNAPEYMQRYIDLIVDHGGLYDRQQAAHIAGVSPQRIDQLVRKGLLRYVSLSLETPNGPLLIDQTVPGKDLTAWLATPKAKGGRGHRVASRPQEAMAA